MILGDIFSRVLSTIQSQINGMTAWMVQLQNIGTSLAQKVQQKLQKFMQTLTGEPRSKNDYWRILGLYFEKRFVIIATVVTCVLGYLLIAFAYPWAEGKLWRATIKLDSPKYSKFSGKAKVVDSMGITIYIGDMSNGAPEGFGSQYNSDGLLVYKGNFVSGKYSGEGETYSTDGIMTYKGQFDNNKAHGEGQQYNNVGKIIYTGQFAVGQRSGTGIEYDAKTTVKKYYGEFANDTREGNGVEYADDGETIVYEGSFKAGVYDGTGKLYDSGNLLYSGSFMNGFYSGDGILYDKDTGAMVYAGEFKEGKYILQPSMMMSYTYVNTFDYTNAAGVGISSDPLHTLQLHPNIKFAANLKNGWQPYAFAGMVWNIMNNTQYTANNIVLPSMSIKPYVEYGIGVQKTWKDSITGYLQTMIRNGGRQGVALQFGLRISI